jgi:hypothetical protein
MATPTLIFYAVTSFFLGLIASSLGGARAILVMLEGDASVGSPSPEPWQSFLTVLTIAVPILFVAVAAMSLLDRRNERPLSARDLEAFLEATAERRT